MVKREEGISDMKKTTGKERVFKFIILFMLLFVSAGILCSLCSCRSNKVYVFSPEDAITGEEQAAIIHHIRYFVKHSNLKLTKAERKFVDYTPPVVKIRYTGKKRGSLLVRWDFPNFRSIILKRHGYLLFEGKIRWDVRIITDRSTPTIPRSFYGAKGEEISLSQPAIREALKKWQGDPEPVKK